MAYKIQVEVRGSDEWTTYPTTYSAETYGSTAEAHRRATDAAYRIKSGTGRNAVVVPAND